MQFSCELLPKPTEFRTPKRLLSTLLEWICLFLLISAACKCVVHNNLTNNKKSYQQMNIFCVLYEKKCTFAFGKVPTK